MGRKKPAAVRITLSNS